MPEQAEVRLQVFNTNGRQIKQLLDKQMTAGSHHVALNGEDMASGPYLIHLQATNEAGQSIQKVINVHLIK